MNYRVDKADHQVFVDRIFYSYQAVFIASLVCNRQGYYTMQPPFRIKGEDEDYRDYADCGDLHISKTGKDPWDIIEVKHSKKINFTDRDSWPYRNIFVCSKYSMDQKDVAPHSFMILNEPLSHMIIIPVAKTFKDWFVHPGYDDSRKQKYDIHVIEKYHKDIVFKSVKELISGKTK